ncbi:MAG: DUF1287 domain-containing protein [Clostridiaceae bacterium]
MKKLLKGFIKFIVVIIVLAIILSYFLPEGNILKKGINIITYEISYIFKKSVHVPSEFSLKDNNNNGIPDPIDIVNGAREEAENKTDYQSNYYLGGYPPEGEGVCTDVVWRGLIEADINLKAQMDDDIGNNIQLYPRTGGKPDPNIDFRRVVNQDVFFQRYCEILSIELIPGDVENLVNWQPGDIVVFLEGTEHVGIISDKRDKEGVPYIIHNSPPHAKEEKLTRLTANNKITGHYRWMY